MYPGVPAPVVDYPLPLSKSLQGKYFIGETDQLLPTDNNRTWAGLINPLDSGVHLYVDIYVISNLSADPLVSQICFCQSLPTNAKLSHEISNSNLTYRPQPVPRGQVQFGEALDTAAFTAVPVSTRVVSPYSSTASEKRGHWIIGPGTAILFTLTGTFDYPNPAVVSIGWWEETAGHY